MTSEITITVTTTLTAADVFRIIIGFSRVQFTCINSAVHCEFPIPSESLHLSDENGVPTIHTEAELEKDPSVSISCDAYHCQIDYCDNDILSLTATPLTNNDCSNISLYVTQYF